MTELSTQQREAMEAIKKWYQAGPFEPFRLFGPAGTGKTTMAREVPLTLGLTDVQYGAYTGKAASVLRSKGCTPAGTLHSLVYVPRANAETLTKLRNAKMRLANLQDQANQATEQPLLDPGLTREIAIVVEAEVAQLDKEARTIGFEWNPGSVLAGSDLLILDEVSMVDARLAADIERFKVPVLVLGDPEQLEPVGGEGYYIDAEPNYALTEIHRQALESPVLELATRVRLSADSRFGLRDSDMKPRSMTLAMEADQVLCWKNSTRWSLTHAIRGRLGRVPGQVVAGDRIMCLQNNRTLGVFNGQQFDVLQAEPGALGPRLTVLDDAGHERELLSFSSGFEGLEAQRRAKSNYLGGRGQRGLFTFSQVVTVHKAQGSEWRNVFVVNESRALARVTAQRQGIMAGHAAGRRWLYTAISRASESVNVTAC